MAMELQIKFCEETKRPMFAPKSGKCYSCGKGVVDTDKRHLTGCESCHRSWCD